MPKRRWLRSIQFSVLLMFQIPIWLVAAEVSWIAGAGPGDWFDPMNWSTGTIPLADDHASVSNDGVAVIADGAVSVGGVFLGGTGGALSLSNAEITAGFLDVDSTGQIGFDAGTMRVSGSLEVKGVADFGTALSELIALEGSSVDLSHGTLLNLSSLAFSGHEGSTLFLPRCRSLMGPPSTGREVRSVGMRAR